MRSAGEAAALFLAITMLTSGCAVLQPVTRNPSERWAFVALTTRCNRLL